MTSSPAPFDDPLPIDSLQINSVEFDPEEMNALHDRDMKPPILKLRRVARAQRLVMLALLLNVGANATYHVLATYTDGFGNIGFIISLCSSLFAAYAVYQLANTLFGVGRAILLSPLMFVPLVSVVALLIANQKAMSFLKRHHIHVGFLGVDPNSID